MWLTTYIESVAEHEALFHVMGLLEDGTEQEIFRLRQKGMRLQRAPKVLADEKYLYILLEGIDNEDGKERIYGDIVGTDVQGFHPFLYRYDKENGQIEWIEIKDETTTLLLDAFTHEGESVWISQQFKGLLFGLHLGWYLGAEGYCSYGIGIDLETILVTIYDKTWQEVDSIALDAWCYAIEWGDSSVLISDQKEGFKSHLVYFDDLSVEQYAVSDYEWSTIWGSLDELENQKCQWVYLNSCNQYVLTQTEEKIIERNETKILFFSSL